VFHLNPIFQIAAKSDLIIDYKQQIHTSLQALSFFKHSELHQDEHIPLDQPEKVPRSL
jgi:hypothetical protein